ncbi:MAG TPA: NADH-quinone oxidoreductase subunit A [Gammaproteobacteria bacterium]
MSDGALWPLGVYCGAVLALVALVLGASHVLGERHRDRATGDPFESGVVPVHRARFRMRAKFYVVAMLFVIFDVEAVFILTWGLVAREGGWPAYVEIAIFVGVLLAALAYLWRLGALDWGPRAARRPAPSARARAAERASAEAAARARAATTAGATSD